MDCVQATDGARITTGCENTVRMADTASLGAVY
jgi:hypothetical protein